MVIRVECELGACTFGGLVGSRLHLRCCQMMRGLGGEYAARNQSIVRGVHNCLFRPKCDTSYSVVCTVLVNLHLKFDFICSIAATYCHPGSRAAQIDTYRYLLAR